MMEDKILYGAYAAEKIYEENIQFVSHLRTRGHRIPKLVNLMVGNSVASQSYLNGIKKACDKIQIEYELLNYPENTSESEIIKVIHDLNKNRTIDGILIQMPLPAHIDKKKIILEIDPNKDVDGMHPMNVGLLTSGQKAFAPCTAKAVMALLDAYEIDLKGKNVVVLGRSDVIGKPVALMCLAKHATVTICHSRTEKIEKVASKADILISAIGQAKWVDRKWIKKDAIILDVGVNVDENGKLCGDVNFQDVIEKAAMITPVPKGVGVVTNAVLMNNVLDAYRRREK